jgi:hypothetical protein
VERLLRTTAEIPDLVDRLRRPDPPSRLAGVLRERRALELTWAWLLGDPATRERLDWYVERASHIRAELRGDDVVALGVPRGPAVARVLGRLRDARLDDLVTDRDGERALVRDWLRDDSGPSPARESPTDPTRKEH